jgi:alpha-1,4-digalacturonate transport system substrate-binding protein
VFTYSTAAIAPAAYQLQGYKYNRAIMLATVTRVTQAIVGEISVDEAVNKIRTDMTEAVKQAEK